MCVNHQVPVGWSKKTSVPAQAIQWTDVRKSTCRERAEVATLEQTKMAMFYKKQGKPSANLLSNQEERKGSSLVMLIFYDFLVFLVQKCSTISCQRVPKRLPAGDISHKIGQHFEAGKSIIFCWMILPMLTEIVASAIMKSPKSSIVFCSHDIPLIVEYTVATSQFEMWLMYVDIHS